jgi:hypothetical protein
MQEDLDLYGNERNWLGTWFSLGIMVGTIPAQMLQLSHIRPSILIPTCEICWSALVIGMGFTHSIKVVRCYSPISQGLLTDTLQDVRSAFLHRLVRIMRFSWIHRHARQLVWS